MAFKKEEKELISEDRYDINNPVHRNMILEFEKKYGGRTLIEILGLEGYFRKTDEYPEGAINGGYLSEIYDIKEKYKSLGRLSARRDLVRKQEIEKMKGTLLTV